MVATEMAPLYTTPEAAKFLRISEASLERWRTTGEGPAFIKIGRKVAYSLVDLEWWVKQQRREHTAA